MLTRLSVTNYALIRELQVDFEPGFNIITGETGAGKSILLDALGLIMGDRADLQLFRDSGNKCVVEGTFRLTNHDLDAFFKDNDIDFDEETILRREITPSGKSRAFINDTPVGLNIMKELGLNLIDIHSQHQNLDLASNHFQLKIIDSVADTSGLKGLYREKLLAYRKTVETLAQLRDMAEKSKSDLDYYQFQYTQLHDARLRENEQDELEMELKVLTHSEEIKNTLADVLQTLDNEQSSSINQLKEVSKKLSRISNYLPPAGHLPERIESCYLELKDILNETEALAEKIEYDPDRLAKVNERLGQIYDLEQKHHVSSVAELLALQNQFGEKMSEAEGYSGEIERLEKLEKVQMSELKTASGKLSGKRAGVFKQVQERTTSVLQQLGMPNARFSIRHTVTGNFSPSGNDLIEFLFSANKDIEPGEISRIASGGEMSRLMLAIKTLASGSKMLPTIIFDEIDSGISGETAFKMAAILKVLSASAQVINITHLPQIAGKGDSHYIVYKVENDEGTSTFMKKLSEGERVAEIAKMMAGDKVSESSLDTARELLRRSL